MGSPWWRLFQRPKPAATRPIELEALVVPAGATLVVLRTSRRVSPSERAKLQEAVRTLRERSGGVKVVIFEDSTAWELAVVSE